MSRVGIAVLCVSLSLTCTSCAKLPVIQVRLAEPTVLPDADGTMNPPVAVFQRYKCKPASTRENFERRVVIDTLAAHPGRPKGSPQRAAIAWANPNEPVMDRVDLCTESTYGITILLPENYEIRRLELLRAKSETLYESIQLGEERLQENLASELQLLDEESRKKLIEHNESALKELATLRQSLLTEGISLSDMRERLKDSEPMGQLLANEGVLSADDRARDSLLSRGSLETLVGQIEDWRLELDRIKARIVALELMVANPNKPYPRVVRGWMETKYQTKYTVAGAIPFVLEDEYLDWLRDGKVVTVASYDPSELPEDAALASQRSGLPESWPESGITVFEYVEEMATVPREPVGGTRPSTSVSRRASFDATARAVTGRNGTTRTYLTSTSGHRSWVFGEDLTPPSNIEVWLQDENGVPVEKLYPGEPRPEPGKAFVRQIAGVEGGALDPVREAQKRGHLIAVTKLGNRLAPEDHATIQRVYARELERAKRAVQK